MAFSVLSLCILSWLPVRLWADPFQFQLSASLTKLAWQHTKSHILPRKANSLSFPGHSQFPILCQSQTLILGALAPYLCQRVYQIASLFRNLLSLLQLILPRVNFNKDISLRLHRRIGRSANLCKESLLNKFGRCEYANLLVTLRHCKKMPDCQSVPRWITCNTPTSQELCPNQFPVLNTHGLHSYV